MLAEENVEATVREFYAADETVVLKPRYKSIVLTKDSQVQGVVVTVIPEL